MTDPTAINAVSSQLKALDAAIGSNFFTPMAGAIDAYVTTVGEDEAADQATIGSLQMQISSLPALQSELTKLKADIAQLNTDAT